MHGLSVSILVAILVAGLTSGCTSRAVYGSLQSMQRNQCLEQQDASLRERCLAAAEPTYDEYDRQR